MISQQLQDNIVSPKCFCIGSNKTGTTSIQAALSALGFRMGNQATAELLIEDWARRDFRRIIEFCQTADAFQDTPFSLDYTYIVADLAFPSSKFILTIRNSPEEWYESITRFHTLIVNKGRLPTPDDLKQFPYRYVGWLWRSQQLNYGIDESTVYNKEIYIRNYITHNEQILRYFEHRPNDLLVLNLSDSGAMDGLCKFLGVDKSNLAMPHLNQSTAV